jgi:predicted ATPase/tetratricopeptide (TPR) repeat protein
MASILGNPIQIWRRPTDEDSYTGLESDLPKRTSSLPATTAHGQRVVTPVSRAHWEASFGPFRLILSRRLLLCGDKPVRLGEPSYNVLLALLVQPGETIDSKTLIMRAWGSTHVEETSLRKAVAALRRALSEAGSTLPYIATVPRRGYRFIEPVVCRDSAASGYTLPTRQSRIIGRDADIAELVSDMTNHRLITVAGPGGIGKTTTALIAAQVALAENRIESIGLVRLDMVEDPNLLVSVFCAAFGIPARSIDRMADIQTFLGHRRMLIVLDSCERIVADTAVFAEKVLALAPNSVIMATSREPLQTQGERIRRLNPLAVPPVGGRLTASEALTFSAAELFVDRAALCHPNFRLTDDTAPIVAEICRRLDGLPLALEVAATRLDSFDLPVLAEVLQGHFRLQMLGRRAALPRHRTLAATLDWSFSTLSEQEQTVLRRLSVFRGPFSFDAARKIAGCQGSTPADIGSLIASLVAKSLVLVGGDQTQGMHRLLDTTRAYARDKLDRSGEADIIARRHALYYEARLTLASHRTDLIWTADWERSYGAELNQIRAALDWATSPSGDPQIALRLTLTGLPLLGHLGLGRECLAWVARAKALPGIQLGQEQLLAMELARGGALAFEDNADAEAAECWRLLGKFDGLVAPQQQFQVLFAQYGGSYISGQFRDCLALGYRMRSVAEAAGDTDAIGIGDHAIGRALLYLGELSDARIALERALSHGTALSRRGFETHRMFDEHVAASCNLATTLMLLGYPERAMELAAEAVDRAYMTGHSSTVCLALGAAGGLIGLECADSTTAGRYIEMLRNYSAQRPGVGLWQHMANIFAATLRSRRCEHGAAVATLKVALGNIRPGRIWPFLTMGLGYLATVLLDAGRYDEALETINETLARCDKAGAFWRYPAYLTVKAEIIDRGGLGTTDETLDCLNQASALSDRQGARLWEPKFTALLKKFEST